MSSICACPKCQKLVTVPDSVDHQAVVRCPLCEAEYPFSDAAAEVPPALIVVVDGVSRLAPEPVAASSAFEPGEHLFEPIDELVADDLAATAASEHAAQPSGEGPAAAAASIDVGEHFFAPTEEHAADAEGTVDVGLWTDGWVKENDTIPIAAGDESLAFTPSEMEAVGEEHEEVDFAALTGAGPARVAAVQSSGEAATSPATPVPPPRKKRPPKKPHPVRLAIGCVISGVLAVPALYLVLFLLNYFGGKRFDQGIYLPGISYTHNEKHWPQWYTKRFATEKIDANGTNGANGVNGAAKTSEKPERPVSSPDFNKSQSFGANDPANAKPSKTDVKTESDSGGKTESQPPQKTDAKTDGSSNPFGESKTETKTDAKTGDGSNPFDTSKTEEKTPSKPDTKTDDSKTEAKTGPDPGFEVPSFEVKPIPNSKSDPDAKSESKTEGESKTDIDSKPATKSEEKTEAKTEEKTESKPDEKTEAKTEEKTESKPEVKSESKPEEKTEAKTEEMPDPKPESKPDSKPEAKTEPAPPGVLGPQTRLVIDAAGLEKALAGAMDSFGCPACKSTGRQTKDGKEIACEICKGAPKTDLGSAVYSKFCNLADAVTFVKAEGDAIAKADSAKAAVRDFLQQLGAVPKKIEEIGPLAGQMIKDKAPGGVLVAGKVKVVGASGAMSGVAVEMDGTPELARVLSPKPLGVAAGDQVLILGVIVPDPAKNLVNYEGKQPVVIWAEMAVKVAK
jgi:hypothetical protein